MAIVTNIKKTYVLWGNKNKTRSSLHIILSIKDSLQQQISFNSNIFGNTCCRYNECSLLLSANKTDLCNVKGCYKKKKIFKIVK